MGHIQIEPVQERHAPAVQRLASDPAIAATSNVPHPYPADGAILWARRAIEGRERGTLFAFVVTETKVGVVGVCSLMGVSVEYGVAGLGYWIGTQYWGRGYATAAARQVLEFGFRELSLERVEAGALERNVASTRVLQKLGFVPTGVRTEHDKGTRRTYVMSRDVWLSHIHRGPL